MKRIIHTPPQVHGVALAELKDWLAITTTRDDNALQAALRSALAMFETFTGQVPLYCVYREYIAADPGWQKLLTRPVNALTEWAGFNAPGEPVNPNPLDIELDIEADGTGRARVLNPQVAQRITVYVEAGMAMSWQSLPDAIRQGVIRLAAHDWRERDAGKGSTTVPPASVAALWRPYRLMWLT